MKTYTTKIRLYILAKLSERDRSYEELRQLLVRYGMNDHYSIYIKRLVTSGLVDKTNNIYNITSSGRMLLEQN